MTRLVDPLAGLRAQDYIDRAMRGSSPRRLMREAMRGSTGRDSDPTIELSDEEQESIVRKAGRVSASGLSTVANVLDLPGSVVRDTISYVGGNSRANPFDQLAPWNWGTSENRTTGRDLLRQFGMAGKRDTWGNFAAGMAVDVATDPLTYFGGAGVVGKTLSKSGVGLKAAGLTDNVLGAAARKAGVDVTQVGERYAYRTVTVGDVLKEAKRTGVPDAVDRFAAAMKVDVADVAKMEGENIAGLARMKFPFAEEIMIGAGKNPNNNLLSKAAQRLFKAAGMKPSDLKTPMDTLTEAVRYSLPGRVAAATFSAPMMGMLSEAGQRIAPKLFNRRREAEWRVASDIMDLADELKVAGLDDAESSLALRAMMEGAYSRPDVQQAIDRLSGGNSQLSQQSIQKVAEIGAKLSGMNKAALDRLVGLGAMSGGLDDEVIEYAARYAGAAPEAAVRGNRRPLAMDDSTLFRRKEALRNNLGGTVMLDSILRDPDIDTAILGARTEKDAIAAAKSVLETKYGSQYQGVTPAGLGLRDVVDAQGNVVADRLELLAEYMVKNPAARKNGLFTTHALADAFRSLNAKSVRAEIVDAGYDILAGGLNAGAATGKKVGDILKEGKLDIDTAWQVLANRAGLSNVAKDDVLARLVPDDVADDFTRKWAKYAGPEADAKILKAYDSFTALFKAGVLSWPGRITRDAFSGQAHSMMVGMWDHKSASDWEKLLMGEVVEGAHEIPAVKKWLAEHGRQATPEEGTRALKIMFGAQSAETGFAMREAPTSGMPYAKGLDELTGVMPGQQKATRFQSIKDIVATAIGKGSKKTSYNPFSVRGVFGTEETTFAPVVAMERLGKHVDDMNRGVPFLNLLKKGYDPAAAKRAIDEAQVTYDPATYTQFERQFLKRIFPFYAFSSRMFAHVMKELAQNPGGPLAQVIRQFNRARNPSVATPDYVADTASIPLGELPDGSKRYLTGIGFMFEDPLQFMTGSPRQTLMEALSRTNPLVKAPIEWATGESFFQRGLQGGRPLEEMDPNIGRIIANVNQLAQNPKAFITGGDTTRTKAKPFLGSPVEFVAANSPLSRLLTTARILTDPRKGMVAKAALLGTGVRMSDVSPAAQQALLEERLTELQRDMGARTFQKVWIPPEVKAAMSPQQRAKSDAYEIMRKNLEHDRKVRRKEQEQVGK